MGFNKKACWMNFKKNHDQNHIWNNIQLGLLETHLFVKAYPKQPEIKKITLFKHFSLKH